jgi:hypothetical protein
VSIVRIAKIPGRGLVMRVVERYTAPRHHHGAVTPCGWDVQVRRCTPGRSGHTQHELSFSSFTEACEFVDSLL